MKIRTLIHAVPDCHAQSIRRQEGEATRQHAWLANDRSKLLPGCRRPHRRRPGVLAVCFACGLLVSGETLGQPFKPASDGIVLETLRAGAVDASTRELRDMRKAHAADPSDARIAIRLASAFVERYQATADPRFLSYSEAALSRWWNASEAPVDVLLLRATIRQSVHEFDLALEDLDQVLERDSSRAQAWLTRATILQVTGDYEEAARSLAVLTSLSPGLIATASAATLASLTGQASNAYQLLERALTRDARSSSAHRAWALSALAEMAVRLGKNDEANKHFRAALVLSGNDPYTLGAYADYLLDQSRALEVVSLLRDDARIDGLLLRLAIAEHQLQLPEGQVNIETLRVRFEALRRRGDTVHRREEAMFALKLANEPSRALQLARENWQVQKETADARILLESALATGNSAAAEPVLDWLRRNSVEDVRLEALVSKLGIRSRHVESDLISGREG